MDLTKFESMTTEELREFVKQKDFDIGHMIKTDLNKLLAERDMAQEVIDKRTK